MCLIPEKTERTALNNNRLTAGISFSYDKNSRNNQLEGGEPWHRSR
jgi:hypothetical protein